MIDKPMYMDKIMFYVDIPFAKILTGLADVANQLF